MYLGTPEFLVQRSGHAPGAQDMKSSKITLLRQLN